MTTPVGGGSADMDGPWAPPRAVTPAGPQLSGYPQPGPTPPGYGQLSYGRPRVRRVPAPYTGPPRYGPTHPNWGFPPVALSRPPAVERPLPLPTGLRAGAVLALVTAVGAAATAGAESWRFALMLAGRTEVLSARTVAASTLTVTIAAYLATALGLLTILLVARTVAAYYLAAARRANLRPTRTRLETRMLVPGWNLYAAGPVLIEALHLGHAGYAVSRGAPPVGPLPRRHRLLAGAWWAAWVVSGALAVATLVVTVIHLWRPGTQLAADLVQLHIATDLAAALVGALTAAVLLTLRRVWLGPRARETDGWVVQAPHTAPPIDGVETVPSAAAGTVPGAAAETPPIATVEADPAEGETGLTDAGADLGEHGGRQ